MPFLLSWAIAEIKRIISRLSQHDVEIGALRRQQTTSAAITNLTGSGSPEGTVTGNVGQIYIDLSTGNLYKKIANNGGTTGWV